MTLRMANIKSNHNRESRSGVFPNYSSRQDQRKREVSNHTGWSTRVRKQGKISKDGGPKARDIDKMVLYIST